MSIKLQQIILFCANVERLVEFYSRHFQLTVIGEASPTWTVLRAGAVEIGLHRIPDEYLGTSQDQFRIEDSNVKLVFQVDNDLKALRERLVDTGVEVGEVKVFEGYPFVVCDGKDPEGNVFQLTQQL